MSLSPLTPEQEQEIVKACAVFNLVPPFTLEEAKRRYRDLAKIYHPDARPLGDQTIFANMSKSFDIIEKNFDLLRVGKFGFLRNSNSAGTALIEELRDTKVKLAEREKRIRDLNEETKVLRSAVKGKDYAGNLKKIVWSMVALGFVIIAFVAGVSKGFQTPIGKFDPTVSLPVTVVVSPDKTYYGIDQTTGSLQAVFAEKKAEVYLRDSEIVITGSKAKFSTSPTLHLEFPADTTATANAKRSFRQNPNNSGENQP